MKYAWCQFWVVEFCQCTTVVAGSFKYGMHAFRSNNLMFTIYGDRYCFSIICYIFQCMLRGMGVFRGCTPRFSGNWCLQYDVILHRVITALVCMYVCAIQIHISKLYSTHGTCIYIENKTWEMLNIGHRTTVIQKLIVAKEHRYKCLNSLISLWGILKESGRVGMGGWKCYMA